ncbi:uncharacterized protein PV06_00254 [Exophiala oligosperma]|uniref:aldehyde dehydrogenase (NAD(+)) n=1 Tax=Exophiala oligosperma TaxID=215243 RepID=A0A0D2B5P2_9EURO|nr:uncharacterized protein PV06_00254 [Exophiala oligosperma]KIW47566.1 hypothetical protein PV06_00254 [Exophiala oligosperma]
MGSIGPYSDAGGAFNPFKGYFNSIDGTLRPTKETRHGTNPATLETLPEVPVATEKEDQAAVSAGQRAFKSWSQKPWSTRRDAVLSFADAIETHAQGLAELLTMEQGKPTSLATGEVSYTLNWMRGMAKIEFIDEMRTTKQGFKVIIRYVPLGLTVGILPWNYPVAQLCQKMLQAVLTGNTIIIKPSPFTPYCGLKLGELAQRCFPPGVVQVLSGDNLLGPMLTGHPDIKKISFTGSTATGKHIMQNAAKTLKRVTLELGGNDPAIVCKDVDVDVVAPQIASLAFYNSGQVCLAIKRVYVHASIYDSFKSVVVRHVNGLKVGNGREDGVALGPVQNQMQYDKVSGFLSAAEKEGWTVVAGGVSTKQPGTGYFIQPAVIDRPPDDSSIVTEEPFGPIMPLLAWTDKDDVISRANDTPMGLGASVWSKNLDEARSIAEKLEAGSVWLNAHLALDVSVPFGGHKESGIGCEGGIEGLKAFCNIQSLYLSS